MEEKNKKELIELVKSLQKEKQDLEKAYIELDLECRDLRTENEELKSPKFESWKLKFFRLKEEFDKELAEHEEFAKKANAEIERLKIDIKNEKNWGKIQTKQAVKDTAKEIFTDLLKEFSSRKSCGNADVVVREMATWKGVEVE